MKFKYICSVCGEEFDKRKDCADYFNQQTREN